MDRTMWQDHLLVCSKLFVQHTKLFMSKKNGYMPALSNETCTPLSVRCSSLNGRCSPLIGRCPSLSRRYSPVMGRGSPVNTRCSPYDELYSLHSGHCSPANGYCSPVNGYSSPPLNGSCSPLNGYCSPQHIANKNGTNNGFSKEFTQELANLTSQIAEQLNVYDDLSEDEPQTASTGESPPVRGSAAHVYPMSPPTPPPPLPPPETMPTAISRLAVQDIHSTISRPTEATDSHLDSHLPRVPDSHVSVLHQHGIQDIRAAISHQPVVSQVPDAATSQQQEPSQVETPRNVISRPPMPMMVSSATWQTQAPVETQPDSATSTPRHNVPDMRDGLASRLCEELRLVSTDRDSLREELTRVQAKLKSECDWAMSELQTLKQYHGETLKKCERAVKEADMSRQKYKLTKINMDQSVAEVNQLKNAHREISAEKERLEHQLMQLQLLREEDRREMEELRQQQREVLSESGSSEVLNKVCTSAFDKYDAVKQELDDLRSRFADLNAAHSEKSTKLELMREESQILRKQMEETVAEKMAALNEKKLLQQQCTSAITNWHAAMCEKEDLEKNQNKVKKECGEYKRMLSENTKTHKDYVRLRIERDAMFHEYSLVMSERDTVHKEIEQLQDKLSDTEKQTSSLEKEKKAALDEVETLRREITSALQDRDQALKQVNELKERQQTDTDGGSMIAERDMPQMDRYHSDRGLRGSFDPLQTEEGKEAVNKEADSLRKEVDKLQAELADAIQEAEVSKRRRDWAFSERDKIVLERESIRTLCDRLRRERDRAVSELAEALRDLDDLKKQKNDAMKELKEIKEKYDGMLEKEARKNQLNSVGHNHSRDSAIDADLQEWETETLQFDISNTHTPDDLGFDLVGGKDDPQLPNDNSIFVSSVSKSSCAHGKLKVNDQIIKVNNIDVTNVDRRTALQAAKQSGKHINMVVRRRKSTGSKPVQPVHLNLSGGRDLGISLGQGLYITRITPGSAAAREGSLAIGDRILHVNGRSVDNMSVGDVMRLVDEGGDIIVLNVLKYGSTPQNSLVSSSASSGHNLTDTSSPDNLSSPTKSPHDHAWLSSSPDSGKGGGDNFRTSGSQTDSLDSPQNGLQNMHHHHHNDNNNHNSFTRSYDQRMGQSVEERPNFLDRIFGKSHAHRDHDRETRSHEKRTRARPRQRDNRKAVSHITPSPGRPTQEEEEVVDELNAIYNQYTKTLASSGSSGKSNVEKRRRSDKKQNGGTWPKCQSQVMDYTISPPFPAPHKKERPLLTSLVNDFYSRPRDNDSAVPPTPPERSDSFKRSASIKHSPQNSDTAVKYGHASKSASYLTSPNKPSHVSHIEKRHPEQLLSPNSALYEKNDFDSLSSSSSLQYNTNSSPDVVSLNTSPDHTVVSAQSDPNCIEQYLQRSTRSGRPTSAPARGRRTRRELAVIGHSGGHRSRMDQTPQKPKTLDLQPIYSPRPLPHSGGQAITPSSNQSREQSRDASRDKTSAFHAAMTTTTIAQMKPSHSHPSNAMSHSTHMMRTSSNPPVYNIISTHSVTPTSHGTMTTGTVSPPPQSMSSSQHRGQTIRSQRYSPAPGCLPPRHPSHSYAQPGSGRSGAAGMELSNSMDTYSYHRKIERNTTPSPSPSQQSSILDRSMTTSSEDFPYNRVLPRTCYVRNTMEIPTDGSSTFPNRRHHERIRIPSNQSVMSSKSSVGKMSATSSVEKVSDRGSPTSPFMPVDYMIAKQTGSLPKALTDRNRKRPQAGETRNIYVEKSQEPLGIKIERGSCGGIFVLSVSENSLAAQAGIEVGDQLLELCGINMRNATFQHAAKVLQECGDSITMLVQYNPDNYLEEGESSSSNSSPDTSATNTPETGRTHQTTSTSMTTITPHHHGHMGSEVSSHHTHMGSDVSTITPDSPQMSPSHSAKPSEVSYINLPCEPRHVFLKKVLPHDSLGVNLLGGNAVGIFVRDVQPNSIAAQANVLRCGDQLLEYNGCNLRVVTAEQAAVEISKPCETVSILAQYNIARFTKIAEQPGDALYIRVLIDREAERDEELPLKRDSILYIDNTLHKGMMGVWRAWLLDDEGNKIRCGTIPSKARLEDEVAQRRSISDLHDDDLKGSRRGSASARRSFFRRKRHQRNNSKDSRDLSSAVNSYSDVSINSDSVTYIEDGSLVALQRVERLECMMCRPVLILGPLAEPLISKLTSESPDKYCKCEPEIFKGSVSSLETRHGVSLFVDFKQQDSHCEYITVSAVKEIIDKNRHCLLNVSPAAVDALHKVQIYPIVLFIRHKSSKQIREVKDTRFLPEKLSNKVAKELFETFQKYDQEYRHCFSEIIQGGNLALMCLQIKAAIDKEQKKLLWVPSGML